MDNNGKDQLLNLVSSIEDNYIIEYLLNFVKLYLKRWG